MKLLVALLVLLCIFSAVQCQNSVQNGTLTVKQVEPTSESVGISKRATDYSYDEEYEDDNYDSYGDEAAYEDEPVYDDEEEERDIYRRSAPLEYDDYDEDYDGEDDEDYDDNEADEEYNNDIDEGVEDYDEDYDGDEEWGDSRSKRSSHYDDDDEELEDEEEEGDEDDENEEDDDEEDDEDLEGGLIDSEYEQNDDDYQITTAADEEDYDSEENDDEDNDDGDDDDDYDDDYEEEEDGERTRRSLGEDDYPELDYDEDDYSAGMEDEEDDEDNYSYTEEEAFDDEELPDDDEDYDYDGEELGRIQKRFSEKTPKHRLKARIATLNNKIHEIRSKEYYNTVPCWLEKADEMEELRSQLQGYLGGEGPQLSYTATDSDKSPQEMSTFELKSEIESLKTKISYFQNNPNYDKDYYKCNRELAESMELYLVKLESELARREVNKPLRRMRGRDGSIRPDFTPREMEESNPEEEEEEDSEYDYYDYEEEESDRIQKRFVAPQSPPPGSANVEEMKKSAIRLTQHISAIRSKEYFKTLPCWQKRADNLESRRRRLLFRMMWLGIRVEREHTMSYPPKFLKEMSDAEILEEISSLNKRIKRIRSSPDFNKEKYRCFKKLAENMSRYRQKLRRELNNRNPQMSGEDRVAGEEGQRQERDAPMDTVEEESRPKRDCDEDDGADAPSISQLAAQTVQIEKEIQRKIASKLEDRLNQEVTQKTEEGVLQKTVESAIEKDIDDKVQKKLKQEAGSLPEKVRQLEKNYKELKDELENSPWSRFQQVMMDHVKENSEVGQSISKDEFQKLEQMHKMSKSERKAFTKALRKKIKLSKEEDEDDDDDDDKEIATKEKKVKAKPRPKKPKSGKRAKQQPKRRRKKPKSNRKKNKKKAKESKTEVDKKEPVKEVKAKPKKGNPQKNSGEKKELKQIKTGVNGKKTKGKKGKKTENGKKSKLLKKAKAKKVKTVAKSGAKKPQRKGKVPKNQRRQQLRNALKKQPKRPRGKKPTKKLRPEQKKELLLKKLREMSRKKSSKVDQQTKSRLKNKLENRKKEQGQGLKRRPRKMKTGKKKKPDKKEKRLRVKGKARALKKAKKERKGKKANGLKPDQKKALKRPAVQKKGKTLQDKTKALRGRESHQQKKRKLIEALKRKQQARKKLEKGKKKQKPQVIKKVIKIGTQGELNEQRQKQKVVGQEELNKRKQKNQQVLNKYIRLAAQGKFGRSKALKREKRGVEGSPGEWEISNTISQHNDPLHAQKKDGRSVSIRYQLPPKAETGGLWSSAVVKQPLNDPTHPLEWLGDYNQQNSQPGLKNRRSTNPFESNLETEKTRNEAIKTTDECSKCEVQVGEEVCGSNGKTYNSLCHAIHCGRLREMDVTFGPCEARDPCSHNHCSSSEICVPMTYGPCLTVYANNGRRLPCRQYICVAKEDCGHTEYSEVCGVDGETYPTLCHLQQRGVKLAYSGHCRQALCSGKVCGRNGVTYPSTCHARAHNVRVDYRGTCFAENLEDHVKSCNDVRRTGMCAPTDCPDAVIPEGACCPLCGGGVEVRPQAAQLAELVRDWPEINHLYMIENFLRRLVAREMQSQCELSLTLTDSGAIMMVLEAVDTHHSATCQAAAMDVAEKINRPSSSDDTLRPLARVARLLGGIGANSVQQSVEAQKNIVTGDISQAKAGATNKMINSYNDRVKGVESAAYEYEENSSAYVSASATLATVTTTLVLLLL